MLVEVAALSPTEPAITNVTSEGPHASRELGAVIGHLAQPGDVIALQGELGAGKTVVAQGIAMGLGVQEPVTSPSYVIVTLYRTGRVRLQHVDLYRLADDRDLDSIDWDGLLDEPAVTVVEWPERAGTRLPVDRLHISLDAPPTDRRTMMLSAGGPRSRELLAAVRAHMAAR